MRIAVSCDDKSGQTKSIFGMMPWEMPEPGLSFMNQVAIVSNIFVASVVLPVKRFQVFQ